MQLNRTQSSGRRRTLLASITFSTLPCGASDKDSQCGERSLLKVVYHDCQQPAVAVLRGGTLGIHDKMDLYKDRLQWCSIYSGFDLCRLETAIIGTVRIAAPCLHCRAPLAARVGNCLVCSAKGLLGPWQASSICQGYRQ